jgi:mannose-6-phosphate isomerase-like protein (cupin superfamily)
MSGPTVIAPGAGEVVGDSPDRRVEILADGDALHATWSRFGPGREGADLHVHRRHTDVFYVLEGELTVRLGPEGEGVVVPAGTLARVPPLVVHGFRNASGAELRYLNFHVPGLGFADYLRAMRDGRTLSYDQEPPPADGGRPATEAVIGGRDQAGDGVVVLAEVGDIRIAEVRIEPGGARTPAHRGAHSYYVLEGEMALALPDRELERAGSWVHVPPGVAHAVESSGSRPLGLLHLRQAISQEDHHDASDRRCRPRLRGRDDGRQDELPRLDR